MSKAAPDFRWQGSRILVTGASLGIGRAVPLPFGAGDPSAIRAAVAAAGPAVCLLSAAASSIAGIALPVDGGVTAA